MANSGFTPEDGIFNFSSEGPMNLEWMSRFLEMDESWFNFAWKLRTSIGPLFPFINRVWLCKTADHDEIHIDVPEIYKDGICVFINQANRLPREFSTV